MQASVSKTIWPLISHLSRRSLHVSTPGSRITRRIGPSLHQNKLIQKNCESNLPYIRTKPSSIIKNTRKHNIRQLHQSKTTRTPTLLISSKRGLNKTLFINNTPSRPSILDTKPVTLDELSRYRLELIKNAQKGLPPEQGELKHHFTTFQREVLIPLARTLILSTKALLLAGTGVFSYHAYVNFMVWSRYVIDNIKTYHPELVLTPQNIQITKIAMLLQYLSQTALSSLHYYIPTIQDLYYECYQSIYLPFKRYQLKELLLDIGTPFQQTSPSSSSNTHDDSNNNKSDLQLKLEKILHVENTKYDEQQRRRHTFQQQLKEELLQKTRICTLTGNQLEDIYSVQRYCIENIQVVEHSIQELEKLYYSLETIYHGSYYNMKDLHHEVANRNKLFQYLSHSKHQSTIAEPNNDEIHLDSSTSLTEQSQQQYFSRQDYFSLPTNSFDASPISVDNSFIKNTHIFDHIKGTSHFYDKFMAFNHNVSTSETSQRLEQHLQTHLYKVYNYFVARLPQYKTKTPHIEATMMCGDQTQSVQSLGMFWDFNIQSYYDVAHPITSEMTPTTTSTDSTTTQTTFPLLQRKLSSTSLSIFNNTDELSHITIDERNLSTLHNFDEYHPTQVTLTPQTLLEQLPLPQPTQAMVYQLLTQQLNKQHDQPIHLEHLVSAATAFDNVNEQTIQPELIQTLRRVNVSPMPTMKPFSLDEKIKLQQHLKQIIHDLKGIVLQQYETHHREIVPERYLKLQREYVEQHASDSIHESRRLQSLSMLSLLEQQPELATFYTKEQIDQYHYDINKYYQESIAHLTYNIALSETAQNILENFTSFLSPLYLLSHPLYFSIARNQYAPQVSSNVERFVLNINQDGTVAFGSIPTPYIDELNHIDTKSIPENAPVMQHDSIHDMIYNRATEYATKSTLLYRYKRSHQYSIQKQQQQRRNKQFQHQLQQQQQQQQESLSTIGQLLDHTNPTVQQHHGVLSEGLHPQQHHHHHQQQQQQQPISPIQVELSPQLQELYESLQIPQVRMVFDV